MQLFQSDSRSQNDTEYEKAGKNGYFEDFMAAQSKSDQVFSSDRIPLLLQRDPAFKKFKKFEKKQALTVTNQENGRCKDINQTYRYCNDRVD